MRRLVLLVPILGMLVFAQATGSPQTPASPPRPQMQQVQVFEAQRRLMREYDERLLETVYWSLGTLATVMAVLVGVDHLTAALKAGADPDAQMLRDLGELLERVPSDHRVTVTALQAALRQVRTAARVADRRSR